MRTTKNQTLQGGVGMTKAELIGKMAAGAKISKAAAGKALDAFVDGVKASLKKKRGLLLLDLEPSLFLKKSKKGRNPRTGKEIKIPARKVPKFAPGKAFKDAVLKILLNTGFL